jgi:hypothetical protein
MTDLIVEIDAAAAELLKRATAPDKNEQDEATLVTLAERTKAFDSVVDWAKVRQGLVPPDKTLSKFEQMQRDFNGIGTRKTDKRRRTPSEAEEGRGDDAGGDTVGAVNGADGLFAT